MSLPETTARTHLLGYVMAVVLVLISLVVSGMLALTGIGLDTIEVPTHPATTTAPTPRSTR